MICGIIMLDVTRIIPIVSFVPWALAHNLELSHRFQPAINHVIDCYMIVETLFKKHYLHWIITRDWTLEQALAFARLCQFTRHVQLVLHRHRIISRTTTALADRFAPVKAIRPGKFAPRATSAHLDKTRLTAEQACGTIA